MNNNELLASLWENVAKNTQLSAYVTDRDIVQFKRRVQAEGLPYLTVTLPKLGKSLERSFKQIDCSLEVPAEFMCGKGKAYPMFLCRAWSTLFTEDGSPRFGSATDIEFVKEYAGAVLAIRQLTLMFYKLKLPYSNEVVDAVLTKFVETDAQLEVSDNDLHHFAPLLTRASRVIRRLLHRYDPMDIIPRHGSGASACQTASWTRYGPPRYFGQIDAVYKYTEWYYISMEQIGAVYPHLFAESDVDVPTARVVLVPKDSRGPRLISEEPRETMFLQQGLMRLMYEAIEHYPNVRGQVSCLDQSRNKALACEGSSWNNYATIDLKDASDCVSLELVRALFPQNWVRSLEATRSPQTEMPDETMVSLRKFAPMGSACCFPVEAIVFWALVHAATSECDAGYLNRLFSLNPLTKPPVTVAVFGDDIIVPFDHYHSVVTTLINCGLKVNIDKSYAHGPFRESCGGDFFLGEDVSLVRIGHLPILSGKRNDVSSSKFRLADGMNNLIARYGTQLTEPFVQLFNTAFGETIDVIDIERNGEHRPNGLYLLGLVSCVRKHRLHRDLCVKQFRTIVERTVGFEIDVDDWSHLLRWHLNVYPERSIAEVVLPKRHCYNIGWCTYR